MEGLPPPRSAEMEKIKEETAHQNPKARVKVFMPQQYNSPMGMYSAENVLESFQTQAEGYFDDLDRLVLGRERAGELPDTGRGLLRRS